MRKLTAKQEKFCQEYIKGLNGTQAAIRAKYSKKTAKVIATENLSKPSIMKRLAELQKPALEESKLDAQYVLKRLKQIDELDILDIMNDDLSEFKLLSEWPKEWRISISGLDLMVIANKDENIESIVKKIKWPDKTKNLELIGKHIEIGAFSENFTIKDGENLTPWDSITAGVDKIDEK